MRGVGQDCECRADRADCATVDVGNAVPYRIIIGEVPCFEVVQTVHKNVSAGRVSGDVAIVEIVDDRRYPDGRVDPLETPPSGFRLGGRAFDILFVEQYLPLKIRDLDDITVDDHQMPDASTSEEFGGNAAERPASEYECGRPAQLSLPFLAETGEQCLAMVAGQFVSHDRDHPPIVVRPGESVQNPSANRASAAALLPWTVTSLSRSVGWQYGTAG